MSKDSGSLSPGERFERIEENQDAHERFCEEERRRMWAAYDALREKVNKIEIELGKSNTKLAILMTVLFTVVSVVTKVLLD